MSDTKASAFGTIPALDRASDYLPVLDMSAAAGSNSRNKLITANTLFSSIGTISFRDTSAAFDVTLAFTSAIPLDAGRTVTVDVGNASRALTLYGDFVVPAGGGTAVLAGADNILTGANEVHNAAGFVARPSILQDGVALKGRAGGTFSYTAAITTAALTASRAFTIPAVSADDTFALLGIANAFTGANTFTNAAGIVTRAAATQDGVALVGRAGGTSSYIATITTAALTGNRTLTIPAVSGDDTFALLGVAQTFTAAQTITPATTATIGLTVNGRAVIAADGTGLDLRFGTGMYLGNINGNRISFSNSSAAQKSLIWSDGSYWIVDNAASIGWRNGATTLYSDANNELDLRSGTNAQTFRAYGTYTDASNYVRLSLSASSTAVAITAETAGTGADDVSLSINSAGAGSITFNVGAIQPLFLGSDGFNATIAFFGATPIMQPTRPGQLTDNSGGTSGGNTIAALTDTGGLADIAPVKDAVATLAAKLNAIEAMLSEAAGGLGLCS